MCIYFCYGLIFINKFIKQNHVNNSYCEIKFLGLQQHSYGYRLKTCNNSARNSSGFNIFLLLLIIFLFI